MFVIVSFLPGRKNIHGRAFIKKFREMPKIIDQNQMRQMKYLEIWPTLTKLKPTYGEFGAEKIFLESEMNWVFECVTHKFHELSSMNV